MYTKKRSGTLRFSVHFLAYKNTRFCPFDLRELKNIMTPSGFENLDYITCSDEYEDYIRQRSRCGDINVPIDRLCLGFISNESLRKFFFADEPDGGDLYQLNGLGFIHFVGDIYIDNVSFGVAQEYVYFDRSATENVSPYRNEAP